MARVSTIFLAASLLAAVSAQAMERGGPVKILALGDSTTAGTPRHRSPLEAPPRGEGDERSQYAYWIERKHPDWNVVNHGIAGQRSDEIYDRFKGESGAAYDLVIVLAGVNDLYQGYETAHVKDRLKAIYDLADRRKARVLACTILPYNVSTPEVKRRMDEVNGWIRRTALDRGYLFCDTYGEVNDAAEPGNLAETEDGLHPSANGYRKMGEAIEKSISESGVFGG